MAETVLEVRQLGVRLNPDFSVRIERMLVERGQVVLLNAASGTGKSTVLGLIFGAIPPTEPDRASLRLCGHPVVLDRGQRQGHPPDRIGFVLQTARLVPFLTLEENITLPCRLADMQPDSEWQKHLMQRLGIVKLLDRYPTQVSVGQRQRAAIARAMLGRPALLLLDEPVSALDPANVAAVEALIAELTQEVDAGVVLASHQVEHGMFQGAQLAAHDLISDPVTGGMQSVFSMVHSSSAGEAA